MITIKNIKKEKSIVVVVDLINVGFTEVVPRKKHALILFFKGNVLSVFYIKISRMAQSRPI